MAKQAISLPRQGDVRPTEVAAAVESPATAAYAVKRYVVSLPSVLPLTFEASDATEAYAAYCRHWGITGSDHEPVIKEATDG